MVLAIKDCRRMDHLSFIKHYVKKVFWETLTDCQNSDYIETNKIKAITMFTEIFDCSYSNLFTFDDCFKDYLFHPLT
jgi:hypothetical protein